MIIVYPKISIITPSYNQADFLEETILSIINQNYPNLEFIIIDGGSTDNSIEIIKKYEKHITYWISEKDYGQSHALNKGFARATGEILNWINSDDTLCENSLFNIANAYQKRTNDNLIIIGNGYEIDEKSKIICDRKVLKSNTYISNLNLQIEGNPIQQSIFFTKNILLESGGVNPMLRYPMDIELYCKFQYLNPEIIVIEDFIATFRKHSDSKTISQDYKMILEKINLLKYLDFYDKSDFFKNQISSYISSFPFKKLSIKEKSKLAIIFLKSTPFNKKNKYKYKIVIKKFFNN